MRTRSFASGTRLLPAMPAGGGASARARAARSSLAASFTSAASSSASALAMSLAGKSARCTSTARLTVVTPMAAKVAPAWGVASW